MGIHTLSIAEPSEVLLHSPAGLVMEGSLTNIYLCRGGKWLTPRLSAGGQAGVVRRLLLERGLCVEEDIAVDYLKPGDLCCISNGVRGLTAAKIASKSD